MENKIPWFQTTNQISSDCFRAQHLMKIFYFGASKTHQNPSGNGPWLGTSTSGAPYPEIMCKTPCEPSEKRRKKWACVTALGA